MPQGDIETPMFINEDTVTIFTSYFRKTTRHTAHFKALKTILPLPLLIHFPNSLFILFYFNKYVLVRLTGISLYSQITFVLR